MKSLRDLIPTRILDRNGKATTVHKKVDLNGTAKQFSAPPPLAAPTNKVDIELFQIVSDMNRMMYPADETPDFIHNAETIISKTVTALNAYPEKLRKTILDYIKTETHEKTRGVLYWVQEGWTEATLNEWFSCEEVLQDTQPDQLLRGVHLYPQLPQIEDYTTADERTQEQVTALLAVTARLEKEKFARERANRDDPTLNDFPLETVGYHQAVKLNNDGLIKLILDRPEQADQIAGIILERGTADAELIQEALVTDSPSLHHGVL